MAGTGVGTSKPPLSDVENPTAIYGKQELEALKSRSAEKRLKRKGCYDELGVMNPSVTAPQNFQTHMAEAARPAVSGVSGRCKAHPAHARDQSHYF